MLKLMSGSFGPYCRLCVRRAADGIDRSSGTVRSTVFVVSALSRRTITVSSRAPLRNYKPNRLILQRTIQAKGCLKNMHIKAQRVERPLFRTIPQVVVCAQHVRHMGATSRALGTVGRFLKVRYLFLTGAIGSGVAANQTYESWKRHIPDIEWLKTYIPEPDTLERIAVPFRQARDLVNRIHLPEKGWIGEKLPKIRDMSDWFAQSSNKELGSILSESIISGKQSVLDVLGYHSPSDSDVTSNSALPKIGINPFSKDDTKTTTTFGDRSRQESLNEEILKMQTKYQKEVDRLEKENKDLRKQLNLMEQKTGKKRKMNKSLIDMYSEILDVLTDFDSSYNTQDHLPRVVVVGDQSAGKTSVLEMIARARIFPRGSGEMMTRSPVKVTLSEGPYHVAQFKDSTREFDLTKEEDTEALRKEVEHRMKNSVKNGQTVSSECIAMSVKGPGIQRMVLVDLPGIISTETTVMAPDTKDGIKRLVKSYMENPNAIILCIQDGSLDAERSNVTEVVSQIDPSGKRTIFVLTKVDLAESNLYNPNRIKSILEGRLFPMKALGYFAVVTGKGNSNDSIETIRKYENDFFQKSKLLQDGALKVTQTNTNNLSMAVSELFWKMVKDNIEQQTDAFKATRYNLETEWKNNFPRLRELDRDELFEKAKGDILDEVISLGAISPKQWEIMFRKKLWDKTATHVFENIYLPAAQADSVGEFNTVVDIKLSEWAYHALPKRSVEVGWDVLHQEFSKLAERDKKKNNSEHDEVFNRLKIAVIEASKSTHNWEHKAEESLRVMQRNTLEDRSVQDKQQWDASVHFMEETLKEQLEKNENTLRELTGPGSWEQWRHWTYKTPEQRNRIATKNELERILRPQNKHRPSISQDELTTVKQTLQSQGIEVDADFIKKTWYHVFREKFIKKALQQCNDCKKGFYYYQHGVPNSDLDCHEVVLFWRLYRMLEMTSNALRQQVMNNEARRLERIIKDVLDEFSEDFDRLKKLLTGRPVELAEELKKVRQIQEKLEEFVEALNREK